MSLVDRILGSRLKTSEEGQHKVGVFEGIPMLGLDALGSSSYGPEAALTVLLPLGAAAATYALPVVGLITALLVVVYLSYRQTIEAYPNGGGSFTVAHENLGTKAGVFAAAALILDYLLNVAVGISAGVGALVSAVPSLHGHMLALCLGVLAVITVVNLRGAKESGAAFALPTYLFLGSMALVLGIGLVKAVGAGFHPHPVAMPAAPVATAGVSAAGLWLLVRAFASGCTAMTGVEAVSNGVTAFEEPKVENAQRTLGAIVLALVVLLVAISLLAKAYGIVATDPGKAGYQSVVSMLVAAIVGRGILYYVTLGSTLAILCLSANTSFAGFPRLARLLANEDFLPHAFASRGRRLVYSAGILVLAALSAALLVVFGGVTDRLIPLFAIGALSAFTMSQAGMVVHWRKNGGDRRKILLNGTGAVCTGIALLVVLAAKFTEGAWITVVLVAGLVWTFWSVRRHYAHVERAVHCAAPIDVSQKQAPVVIVPVMRWNLITSKALRFALSMSDEVEALHVAIDDAGVLDINNQWRQHVEEPLKKVGCPLPRLVVVRSPYRRLFGPLLDFLKETQKRAPDRTVAVVIPELVEAHWYQYLLHNQRATALKAALLLHGGGRVVVISVPWYLEEPKAT